MQIDFCLVINIQCSCKLCNMSNFGPLLLYVLPSVVTSSLTVDYFTTQYSPNIQFIAITFNITNTIKYEVSSVWMTDGSLCELLTD